MDSEKAIIKTILIRFQQFVCMWLCVTVCHTSLILTQFHELFGRSYFKPLETQQKRLI